MMSRTSQILIVGSAFLAGLVVFLGLFLYATGLLEVCYTFNRLPHQVAFITR